MTLNAEQLKAVTHFYGPLIIIAGAGTGKTTVITEHIKWLIQKKGVDPDRIFATTFTQKAADEMLARLDEVMPLGYQEPWLGTFHALSDKLLKIEGLEIGLNPNYTIMTATDQWLFLKKHLSVLNLKYFRPLGNPNKFISALIKFFSRLQDEDVQPVEFTALVTARNIKTGPSSEPLDLERLTELAASYSAYEQLKRAESVMDFGDLILYALKLLRERPNLLKKYQTHFSHLLVDEFQDTNYAQYQLIKLFAPPENQPNLTVVGDDNQSVYKFRGASIANILEFKDDYPQSAQVILNHNYRSTQSILDAAYSVIKHNDPETLEVKLGISKKLVSVNNHPGIIRALSFLNTDAEVNWTTSEIIRLVAKEQLTYQNIAVLTRANSQLDSYATAFRAFGIPYQLVANRGLYDQEEVRNLIHFLRVIIDPSDSLALFAVSQMPLFKLEVKLVFSLLSQAKLTGSTLFSVLEQSTNPAAQNFVSIIQTFQNQAATTPVTKLLYQFVLDTGYVNQFLKEESLENQLKIKNLNLFFNKIKRFEDLASDRSVLSFLNALELWLEAGEDPGQAQLEDVDTVSLMTVHAAKGLEFEAVFMGSLVAGRFPMYGRKDPIEVPIDLIKQSIPTGNVVLQEERRVFYVGLTRAKTHLYLTSALDVGGVRKRHLSGFVTETQLSVATMAEPTNALPLVPATKPPVVQTIFSGHYPIRTISYSKLDTFKVCPLKFKYRYLLQIPARPHHSISFGRTIHLTLQQFHEQEMHGNKPSLAELLKLYQDNFIEEGYESETQKQERFEAGSAALTRYFNEYQTVLGSPLLLEQTFKLKLDNLIFVGKIDRVEKTKDGQIGIVDYKTGTPKDQKAVDKDEQLTLYALAATEALGLKPQTLSLYYLEEGGGILTTKRTPVDIEKAKVSLLAQIQTLKTSTFPPKPSLFACPYCEYNRLCPFAKLK